MISAFLYTPTLCVYTYVVCRVDYSQFTKCENQVRPDQSQSQSKDRSIPQNRTMIP